MGAIRRYIGPNTPKEIIEDYLDATGQSWDDLDDARLQAQEDAYDYARDMEVNS